MGEGFIQVYRKTKPPIQVFKYTINLRYCKEDLEQENNQVNIMETSVIPAYFARAEIALH